MVDQEKVQTQLDMQQEQRAGDQAASSASQLQQQMMEDRIHNPQFADTVRDADIPDEYQQDLGADVSKMHAVSNRPAEAHERIYWLRKNKAERRLAESSPGVLLKENPGMLAIAQGANKPQEIDQADAEPMTSGQKRRMRGAFEVSGAMKSLGIEGKGLEALTTATAEHRTVTNKQENKKGAKGKIKAFFD